MSERPERSGAEITAGLSVRTMEIVVAVAAFALGALVIYDSYRLGSSWGSDGPEAGYFPFYIGLLICLSSAGILCQTLFGHASKDRRIFVHRSGLRQVLSMLLPALTYVAAIQLIGLYVASAVYIAGFMMWLGRYGWVTSALLGIAVSVVTFVTFEIWFQVPLYKGVFNPLTLVGY